MYQYQDKNMYPNIIISDCHISNIKVNENLIEIYFSNDGFCVKDIISNKYFRALKAKLEIKEYNIISIQIIRKYKLFNKINNKVYNIDPTSFMKNINTEKWTLEIVEEFYSIMGGYYIGQIHEKKNKYWCNINIRFKELIYHWGNIKYNIDVN